MATEQTDDSTNAVDEMYAVIQEHARRIQSLEDEMTLRKKRLDCRNGDTTRIQPVESVLMAGEAGESATAGGESDQVTHLKKRLVNVVAEKVEQKRQHDDQKKEWQKRHHTLTLQVEDLKRQLGLHHIVRSKVGEIDRRVFSQEFHDRVVNDCVHFLALLLDRVPAEAWADHALKGECEGLAVNLESWSSKCDESREVCGLIKRLYELGGIVITNSHSSERESGPLAISAVEELSYLKARVALLERYETETREWAAVCERKSLELDAMRQSDGSLKRENDELRKKLGEKV